MKNPLPEVCPWDCVISVSVSVRSGKLIFTADRPSGRSEIPLKIDDDAIEPDRIAGWAGKAALTAELKLLRRQL